MGYDERSKELREVAQFNINNLYFKNEFFSQDEYTESHLMVTGEKGNEFLILVFWRKDYELSEIDEMIED